MKKISLYIFLLLSLSINAKQKIILGAHEVPPIQSGKLLGFGMVPEIITASLNEVGYSVEYKFYPLPRLIKLVSNGEILGGMVAKENVPSSEKGKVAFSKILTKSKLVFFYLKSKYPNEFPFNSIEDLGNLKGSKVAVMLGVPEIKLLGSKGMVVEQSNDVDSIIRKLYKGRVDFASTVDIIGIKSIRDTGKDISKFKMSKPILEISGVVVFSRNFFNYEEILNDLEKGFNIAKEKGILYKILEKYYGENNVPPDVLGE